MNPRIDEIIGQIKCLETEMAQELLCHQDALKKDFQDKKIKFENEILDQQRKFKIGLFRYILTTDIRSLISAPFIYSLILPFLMLDLSVMIFQFICFRLYGITKVRRRDYFIFDRSNLAYLNLIEKINCAYCSYGTGLIAYVREVAGKTEQYWCPIKHAKRAYQAHPYYGNFVEYGNAVNYQDELIRLRKELGVSINE